jgi:hypothetical protein
LIFPKDIKASYCPKMTVNSEPSFPFNLLRRAKKVEKSVCQENTHSYYRFRCAPPTTGASAQLTLLFVVSSAPIAGTTSAISNRKNMEIKWFTFSFY